MLPNRDVFITETDAAELLGDAVADRGAKHKYPVIRQDAAPDGPAQFYEDFKEDLDEHGACHYFATERDAGLIKKVEQDQPMCIVGWVLDAIGITPADIGHRLNTTAGVDALIDNLQLGDNFDEGAIALLALAQEQQDGGAAWGDAVATAKAYRAETS